MGQILPHGSTLRLNSNILKLTAIESHLNETLRLLERLDHPSPLDGKASEAETETTGRYLEYVANRTRFMLQEATMLRKQAEQAAIIRND